MNFIQLRYKIHSSTKKYQLHSYQQNRQVFRQSDGTAIQLGNVTRRSIRLVSCPVRPGKRSRCKTGMPCPAPKVGGAIFAQSGEPNKCHLYTYLSRAGSRGSFQTIEQVIYHDKTVKVTSKNCDKFIYYIDRVSGCSSIDPGLLLASELSPQILSANGARKSLLPGICPHLPKQMRVEKDAKQSERHLFPFAFVWVLDKMLF